MLSGDALRFRSQRFSNCFGELCGHICLHAELANPYFQSLGFIDKTTVPGAQGRSIYSSK